MHALLLCAGLALGTTYDDGSLLFLENCNSVVQFSTDDPIAHVAMLFRDEGKTWVYEATPGRVRRVVLDDYLRELAQLNARRDDDDQITAWLLEPKRPYRAEERTAMLEYLDEQLGRRYSVRNYVRSKPGDGIHCAELTSNMLNRSGRFAFENCSKINPAELFTLVEPHYAKPIELPLAIELPRLSWCQRAQQRWSESWTWCRWSWGEAWAWCW